MVEPINPYAPPEQLPPLVTAAIVDSRESCVEYELTLDDYLAFNDFYQRKSPAARAAFRTAWILRTILWSVAGLVAAAWVYRFAPAAFGQTVTMIVVLEVIMLALYPMTRRRALRRAVQHHYLQDNAGMLFVRRSLTLTPEYVVESTPYSQTITRWMGIVDVCVEPEAIYLFTSAVSSRIVPRRVFAGEADFRGFGSIAQAAFERARQAPVASS